jgi:hypothetical protein
MAFTIGTATFTNGSTAVTNVSLSSGTLAYFASGTRMVVGANPVTAEVEAISAPTVTSIELRTAWPHTGGTYAFLANQTSEGLRDAVQAIRTSNSTVQEFIDSISVQPTNNSVVQRTANGRVKTAAATEADDATRLDQTVTLTGNQTVAGVKTFSNNFIANANVGIGTTSPATKLHVVAGSDGEVARFTGAIANRGLRISTTTSPDASGHSILNATSGGSAGIMSFQTDNTERMRIDSAGRLLIGTTNAAVAVNPQNGFVVENGRIFTTVERFHDINQSGLGADPNSLFRFRFQQLEVGGISVTASATSYNTSSDYRLKEDWQPIADPIGRFMQLKPCNFGWKIDGSRMDGFLAHEAQEVVPEAVTGTKDAVRTEEYEVEAAVYEDVVIPAEFDEDGVEVSPERTEQRLVSEAVMGEREVPDYQGIDQAKLVPLLTAALQDAIKKIEELEERIEALEG